MRKLFNALADMTLKSFFEGVEFNPTEDEVRQPVSPALWGK